MLSREGFEDLVRRSWDGDGNDHCSTMDPLQENTSNSDGGSDGHQGRRTFVTEY
ncbi:hypothetical protein F2Q70_00005718 [Brassica cretica]|uniref:Uncharacterized protein n=1 Tax=Brassica cretica TaxID=69181 RepID=A0A8S9ISR2_BRACR|nr:hypothetical protein F2Q70_00005718 [Brassica cretica]